MTEAAYRFSQRVDNYIKYRPRYPHAVLDLLKAECQLSAAHVIADVGSAIGILAGEHTNCTVNVAAWPVLATYHIHVRLESRVCSCYTNLTIKAGCNLMFCHQYPTGTCVGGNARV